MINNKDNMAAHTSSKERRSLSPNACFGPRVRALRRGAGLTQRELADQVGIDVTYLSKIENARLDPPAEGTIRQMALALKAPPEALILLGRKVPAEWRTLLFEEPEIGHFLAAAANLSPAEWRRLTRLARSGRLKPLLLRYAMGPAEIPA